jgi:hypothetical protein
MMRNLPFLRYSYIVISQAFLFSWIIKHEQLVYRSLVVFGVCSTFSDVTDFDLWPVSNS